MSFFLCVQVFWAQLFSKEIWVYPNNGTSHPAGTLFLTLLDLENLAMEHRLAGECTINSDSSRSAVYNAT